MTVGGKHLAVVATLILSSVTACATTPPPAPSAQAGTAAAIEAGQRVYVMRHLWRGEGADPDLTARGTATAARLADLLKGSRVKAVFATATKRAQQTAAPLAARLGLAVTTYDPRDPDALARAVGQVTGDVLVVGHSNTVPALVSLFGGTPPPPLGEHDYGAIYRVDLSSKATQSFDIGAPDPALAE